MMSVRVETCSNGNGLFILLKSSTVAMVGEVGSLSLPRLKAFS